MYYQYLPMHRAPTRKRHLPVIVNPRPLQCICNHSAAPSEPARVHAQAAGLSQPLLQCIQNHSPAPSEPAEVCAPSQQLFMQDDSSLDDELSDFPLTGIQLRLQTQLDNHLGYNHVKQWQTAVQASTPFISTPTLESLVAFLISVVKSHAGKRQLPMNPL